MILLILIILGLCFGSFVNAWVWRLHEQSKPKSKRIAKDTELSITKGRSMCPDCQHTLAANDLVPVISWLSLGGKCRYCHTPISWQYPLIELLTATLFLFTYYSFPLSLQGASSQTLAFCTLLGAVVVGVALSVYDFKWMLLPDKLVKVLAGFGAVFALFMLVGSQNLGRGIIDLLLAIFVSGGLFYLLYQISDGKWIGGGDVKLGLVLGLFLLTPTNAFLMLFAASLLGCLYILPIMAVGKYKKSMHIPFGPFLLIASYVIVLFGSSIFEYYSSLIYL